MNCLTCGDGGYIVTNATYASPYGEQEQCPQCEPHWPMQVLTTIPVNNTYEHKEVENIFNGKFRIPQQYAFNINDPEGNGSVSVIRMEIPAGTEVEVGYTEIRNSLEVLGLDPYIVCRALGFNEVIGECNG